MSREVDFVTVVDNKIEDLIEVKNSDTTVSSSLKYYAQKLNPKNTVQLVGDLKRPFNKEDVLVTSPQAYFVKPPWEEALK